MLNKSFTINPAAPCPRCDFRLLKTWRELDSDEKILAEKMPLSAELSLEQRKRHLFCTRCWFEAAAPESIT